MELYTLDSLLRRAAVVDKFESLIWTERYSSYGDFELRIHSTSEFRRLLTPGTLLAMSESYRVMTVENVSNELDDDGRAMLKITGRSLEAIMENRTARNTFANLSTTPKWVITGTPGDIARAIFDNVCRTNATSPEDEILFLEPGSLFPPSNIEEPSTPFTVELALMNVYEAIKQICEVYDLGFRLVRNFDNSELYFDVYSGNNRTTRQSTLPAVVFSRELDNLTNVSELKSIKNYKNIAYVYHPIGMQIVTADGVPSTISSLDRRVLTVDASDIEIPERAYTVSSDQQASINAALALATSLEPQKIALNKLLQKQRLSSDDVTVITTIVTTSSLTSGQKSDIAAARDTSTGYNATEDAYINAQLQQRGKDELSAHRSLVAFDGEIKVNGPYIYDLNYQLGDLVEMQNFDGASNQMRVTEQIFVSDAEGERAYPTLAIDMFITPGSWFSWDTNDTWSTADGYWGDL